MSLRKSLEKSEGGVWNEFSLAGTHRHIVESEQLHVRHDIGAIRTGHADGGAGEWSDRVGRLRTGEGRPVHAGSPVDRVVVGPTPQDIGAGRAQERVDEWCADDVLDADQRCNVYRRTSGRYPSVKVAPDGVMSSPCWAPSGRK